MNEEFEWKNGKQALYIENQAHIYSLKFSLLYTNTSWTWIQGPFSQSLLAYMTPQNGYVHMKISSSFHEAVHLIIALLSLQM
jgi:hypothetical protein